MTSERALRGQNSELGMDLERVLLPLGMEEFFASYWEQQPLVLTRNDSVYYAGLFAFDDVDRLLCRHDPRRGFRLARKGHVFPLEELFTPDGRLDVPAVYARHARGATIILNDVHRLEPALAHFCRDLELRLQHPAGANLYLTPGHAQGVDAHFDIHDVFVLQIAGRKRWRVYKSPTALPLDDEPFPLERKDTLGPPLYDVELQAGDLLYMPRGFVHEAETSQELSLHLAVGVHCFRWLDVLAEAVKKAARASVSLRQALPHGTFDAGPARQEACARFRRLLLQFAQEASFDEAVEEIEERFLSAMAPLMDGHLSVVQQLDEITADTVVRHRPGMRCRVYREADLAVIRFPGGRVQFPAGTESALSFIAHTKELTAAMVPAVMPESGPQAAGETERPPGQKGLPFGVEAAIRAGMAPRRPAVATLSEKSRVLLVRRLVEAGLLVPVSPRVGGP